MRTFLVAVIFAVSISAFAEEPAVQTTQIVDANRQFGLDLYSKLAAADSAKDKNVFFSPFSISTAMSMVYTGAAGETATEMARSMHYISFRTRSGAPFDSGTVATQYKLLLSQLNDQGKKGNFQLSIANSLWAQKDYEFLPAYLELVTKNFDSSLDKVDFKNDAEAARVKINQWVEKKTNDKIKDLFAQGVLTADTRLVLANAIYFKSEWMSQFEKELTKNEKFTLVDGTQKDLPMMNRTAHYRYAETADAQVLELRYKGGDLAMLVLLPKPGAADFATWEKKATTRTTSLGKLSVDLQNKLVDVHLPKWKITSEFKLNDTLQALGMKTAFTAAADFSGMNGKKDLSIQAVVHKAFIEVDENGTEAAAATGIAFAPTSAAQVQNPEQPTVFRADHPYLFLIRDTKSGAILFIGRVMDPSATN